MSEELNRPFDLSDMADDIADYVASHGVLWQPEIAGCLKSEGVYVYNAVQLAERAVNIASNARLVYLFLADVKHFDMGSIKDIYSLGQLHYAAHEMTTFIAFYEAGLYWAL